jgi:hypothetical protein
MFSGNPVGTNLQTTPQTQFDFFRPNSPETSQMSLAVQLLDQHRKEQEAPIKQGLGDFAEGIGNLIDMPNKQAAYNKLTGQDGGDYDPNANPIETHSLLTRAKGLETADKLFSPLLTFAAARSNARATNALARSKYEQDLKQYQDSQTQKKAETAFIRDAVVRARPIIDQIRKDPLNAGEARVQLQNLVGDLFQSADPDNINLGSTAKALGDVFQSMGVAGVKIDAQGNAFLDYGASGTGIVGGSPTPQTGNAAAPNGKNGNGTKILLPPGMSMNKPSSTAATSSAPTNTPLPTGFVPKGADPKFAQVFNQALALEKTPPALIPLAWATAEQESSLGKDKSVWKANGSGAIGYMQVTPGAWRDFGGKDLTNINDPLQNTRAGLRELMAHYKRYKGDLKQVAAHYYGVGKAPDGDPSTSQYVAQVIGKMQKYQSQLGGATVPNGSNVAVPTQAQVGGQPPALAAYVDRAPQINVTHDTNQAKIQTALDGLDSNPRYQYAQKDKEAMRVQLEGQLRADEAVRNRELNANDNQIRADQKEKDRVKAAAKQQGIFKPLPQYAVTLKNTVSDLTSGLNNYFGDVSQINDWLENGPGIVNQAKRAGGNFLGSNGVNVGDDVGKYSQVANFLEQTAFKGIKVLQGSGVITDQDRAFLTPLTLNSQTSPQQFRYALLALAHSNAATAQRLYTDNANIGVSESIKKELKDEANKAASVFFKLNDLLKVNGKKIYKEDDIRGGKMSTSFNMPAGYAIKGGKIFLGGVDLGLPAPRNQATMDAIEKKVNGVK